MVLSYEICKGRAQSWISQAQGKSKIIPPLGHPAVDMCGLASLLYTMTVDSRAPGFARLVAKLSRSGIRFFVQHPPSMSIASELAH